MTYRTFFAMLASTGALLAATQAGALSSPLITLEDGNSSATFNLDGDDGRAGMNSWVINNTNVMYEENFWFRFGDTPEQSLHQEQYLQSFMTSNTNSDPRDDALNAVYDVMGVGVDVTWLLRGAPSQCCLASDIAESITITNNTGQDGLEFTFFEYTDFDLLPDRSDDIGERLNANVFSISDGFWVTETSVLPTPARWEIESFPVTRNRLTDGLATDLSNSTSPLGPTDATWAVQWNFVLDAGQSVQISKDKNVSAVPLPAAAWFLIGGVGALAAYGRKRRA